MDEITLGITKNLQDFNSVRADVKNKREPKETNNELAVRTVADLKKLLNLVISELFSKT